MKTRCWKMAPLIGVLVLTTSTEWALANPAKIPEPDPGLVAAVHVQTNLLIEGVASGDFEEWYPGLYPGCQWTRQTAEIGSNGLFQVDYIVFDARTKRRVAPQEMSLLLFRPMSPPGTAWRSFARPAPQ